MKNLFAWISWIVLIKQSCSMGQLETCYGHCICPKIHYDKSTLIECYDDNGICKYRLENNFKIISIKCIRDTNNASNDYYEDLPEINMPDTIDRIIFMSCPLIQMPLLNITKKLNPNMQLSSMSIRGSTINENDTLENYHLKGINGLVELDIKDFAKFSNDILMNLTELTSLSFIRDSLILQTEFLYSNTKLVNLTLRNNGLKSLPEDFFKIQNSSLEFIDLSMNSLIYLETNTFEYLYSLKKLFLQDNKLELLHPDTFYNNTKLEILNLGGNHFKNLPGDIFRNNYKLKIISISHNKQYIERLPNGLFKNLKNLKRLVLDDSKIVSLPNDLIWGSEGIINISMEKNELVKIPDDLFKDQKDLVYLNLKHNKINETLREQFKHLSRLKELNLDFNHLTYFSGSTFCEKSLLTKLTLSHNNLKDVDDLISLENLSYLDLSYNKLKSDGYDESYNSATQIIYLDMSNNYVSSIEGIWKSNIKLQSLNLSHNIIHYLTDDDLNFFSYDITIDLKYNNISKMQFDEKSNVGIQKTTQVLIENNPIHCDCNLYKFKDIFHLKFGDLKCSSPPEQKGKLVEQLNLKDLLCSFTKNCSKHCICGKKLFDTSVVWNCSSVVNTIHSDNKSIENYLEDIRSTDTFNNIKKLYLRGNNIPQIIATDIPENIEMLDLRNNNLVDIQHSVMNMLNNLKTLQHINFLRNPIKCDCRNYDLLHFLMEIRDLVDNYKNMTCSNGTKIALIKIHNLCSNDTLITIIYTVLLISILILFFALIMKYYLSKRFEKKCSRLCEAQSNNSQDVKINVPCLSNQNHSLLLEQQSLQ